MASSGNESFEINRKGKEYLDKLTMKIRWPSPAELGSDMLCVFCRGTAKYPFMQCNQGHMICAHEGDGVSNCPGPKETGDGCGPCGMPLILVKMRWYKWMTQRGLYDCPIQDCDGFLQGQNDKNGHMMDVHWDMDWRSPVEFKYIPADRYGSNESLEELPVSEPVAPSMMQISSSANLIPPSDSETSSSDDEEKVGDNNKPRADTPTPPKLSYF